MRKFVLIVICVLAVATPASAGQPLQLQALTRIASKLSGLHAKTLPKVYVASAVSMRRQALRLLDRDYPPDQQAYDETLYHALGLLPEGEQLRPLLELRAAAATGLYDPARHTIYVRSGATRQRALLGQLVHALQDQSFDLRRLSALRKGGRDSALAGVAAVDGHTAFVTRVLRAGSSRALADGPKIGSFLSLEADFPGATGVRFMSTLQNIGGNHAIFSALRRFPATTEQIFHIDAFLGREPAVQIELPLTVGSFGRERQDTFGELDVRALLAVFGVPRLGRVGQGWGGGRTAVYRDGAGTRAEVLALDWDEDSDAAEWAEAVTTYVNEAFDADRPGFPPTVPCAATACWDVAGRSIAFERSGVRTALVFASDVASAAALARQITTT